MILGRASWSPAPRKNDLCPLASDHFAQTGLGSRGGLCPRFWRVSKTGWCFLSGLSPVLRPIPGRVPAPPALAAGVPAGHTAVARRPSQTPGYRLKMKLGPDGSLSRTPGSTRSLRATRPMQLQTAYGVNQIDFGGGIKGTGAGQTIAVIDAGNNPSFVPSTDPNFSTSALAVFDKTFGLPDPPVFGMFNQTGGTTLPAAGPGLGPRNRTRHRMVALDRPRGQYRSSSKAIRQLRRRLVHRHGNRGDQARCVGRLDELRRQRWNTSAAAQWSRSVRSDLLRSLPSPPTRT